MLRYGVRGVAGGIGLAVEANTARKEKKHHKAAVRAEPSDGEAACEHDRGREPDREKTMGAEKATLVQDDEEQWQLDEAQDELLPSASAADGSAKDAYQIVGAFVEQCPPPEYSERAPKYSERAPEHRLCLPVILPQRRPKDRSRGFIRAYAPALAACGIDQAMFLAFLETFYRASQAAPWLNAINLASLAGSFLPHGLSMVVSIAVNMAVKAAMEMQSRARWAPSGSTGSR